MSPPAPARVACLVVLAAGTATAPLDTPRGRLALGALVLFVLGLTRPSPRWLLARLVPALLGLAVLLVPLAAGGAAPRAGTLALRAVGALLLITLVGSTIPLARLGGALRALGVPRVLAATVHGMLWQLDHVGAEARRLLLARRLRGATRFGPELLAQLLVRSTARAERVGLAMRLRGADLATGREGLGTLGALWVLLALAAAAGLHLAARGAG